VPATSSSIWAGSAPPAAKGKEVLAAYGADRLLPAAFAWNFDRDLV
jgi:hypothetical protein